MKNIDDMGVQKKISEAHERLKVAQEKIRNAESFEEVEKICNDYEDDGINVNEDNVSVFTMNGGTLHIFAGLGAEGDGIDSNGYIVVNGGRSFPEGRSRPPRELDSPFRQVRGDIS